MCESRANKFADGLLGHGRNRGVSDESYVFGLEQLEEVSLSKKRRSLGGVTEAMGRCAGG